MERKCVMAMLLVVAVSCGLKEIDSQPVIGDGIWLGPGNTIVGNGSGSGGGHKEIWYAVGVDYPRSYDWKADVEKGSVKCSLVVYADGVAMMKVPVGDEYEVSSDPDMHRIVDGDLYTDYSTFEETVIKRNGEEIIRYAGKEMIVDMAVESGFVYTLGQSRAGEGFSFRINGEVLLERSIGRVFPRIQRVEDGFSLAFFESDGSEMPVCGKCYHYLAGEVCEVPMGKDVLEVWDVVFHEEKVCYIASMLWSSAPVLVLGNERFNLETTDNLDVKSCRFVDGGRDLYIEGVVSQGKGLSSALWKGAKLQTTFQSGYVVSSLCMSDGVLSCVLNGPSAFSPGLIYRDGESFDMPAGYMSMGGRSMAMADGKLYVGLISAADGMVAVWADKEMKPLKINGFISHMSVY